MRHATANNLKDVSIDIPLNRLVVIVGPSGGGKSSLAYDVIYRAAQGQKVEAEVGGLPKRVLALGQQVQPPKGTALSLGEYHLQAMRDLAARLRPGDGFIVDEPCAGRTKEEVRAILMQLRRLVRHGISVLAVEHDRGFIKGADFIVELGPKSGADGGRVVFQSTLAAFRRAGTVTSKSVFSKDSSCVSYRRQPNERAVRMRRRVLSVTHIVRHGLPDIEVRFPLASLVCLRGPCGAGKSTILDVIYRKLYKGKGAWKIRTEDIAETEVVGKQDVRRSYFVDQTPIGRHPSSNVASYLGISDAIRGFYASSPAAKKLGLTKKDFGVGASGMSARKRPVGNVSRVKFSGRSVRDALSLTVAEALDLFRDVPLVRRRLGFLDEAGLGYLALDQPTGASICWTRRRAACTLATYRRSSPSSRRSSTKTTRSSWPTTGRR